MGKSEIVYRLIRNIPEGKVFTYGQVAKLSGVNNPRVVGSVLHRNPNPEKFPCHRVVNYKGEVANNFAFGGSEGQVKKLNDEGVKVVEGRVNLEEYLWEG